MNNINKNITKKIKLLNKTLILKKKPETMEIMIINKDSGFK